MEKEKKCSQCDKGTLVFRTAPLGNMDYVACEDQSRRCDFEDPACLEFEERDE